MLKIGVVGAGHLGKIHLRQLKEIPQYKLVGFYDTNPEIVKTVAAELNVEPFHSLDELIKEVDVVDVVVPTSYHFDCVTAALKKSKHVFVEKPLAGSVIEAKTLVALAQEANVKAQVGHVERFNPAFLAVKDMCDNPMFIEAHRLAQFNPRGTDVSVVLDLMIHDIDIVLSLVKSNVKRISASGVPIVSATPDIANARIEFDNGCVANLTASRISLKKMRKIRMFQKDAYISIDMLTHKTEVVKIRDAAAAEQTDATGMVIEMGQDGKQRKKISLDTPPIEPINSIKMELATFADAILNNRSTVVTIEDGAKALEVAHKIIDKINLIQEA